MSTAACGINCDVCRLKLLDICSSCGAGTSVEAERKIEAQKRILGQGCPILECAKMNHLQYCMRDCAMFPCENFQNGPYPFSEGFLNMQKRRREQNPPGRTPRGSGFTVPVEYWDELAKRDTNALCRASLATPEPSGNLVVNFLNQEILLDIRKRRIMEMADPPRPLEYPLLELILLIYILNASEQPFRNEVVSTAQLKDAHFFQGPHALKTSPLEERFGEDPEGFKRAAERIGGIATEGGDVGFRFLALPKVPLYFQLWLADGDFPAKVSVHFDKSIESHFSADAIWGVVNLVSEALLKNG